VGRILPDLPRTARRLVPLLLLIPLLAGALGLPSATADDLDDAVAQRKAIAAKIRSQRAQVVELSQAQQRVTAAIVKAKTRLNGINANLAEAQADVDQVEAGIALVQASYGNLVDQLEGLDRQLGVLQAEESRRQEALVERKALLAERIREAYAADRVTLLEAVLSADSFTDALSQVGYLLDIGVQDEALAREIVDDIRELAAIQQEVHGTKADIEGLRDEIDARKVELDAQLGELKVARDKLAGLRKKAAVALAAERAEYNELAKDRGALEAAISRSSQARANLTRQIDSIVDQKQREREARIRAARAREAAAREARARANEEREEREREERRREAARRANGNPSGAGSIPSAYNDTLIWPMGGYVSQEYGCTGFGWEPARGGCAHFHSGIDIVAPYGSPIRAAGSGEVLYVGWNYADGYDPAWIVIIAHADNMQTWYGHLQASYVVQAGQWVRQGQVIGYEGNTGHSTGPHLHWMVRLNGAFLNPRLFV
jgi:murein DD-endopeptidase MepM/ murein hydrolase activator NlpD